MSRKILSGIMLTTLMLSFCGFVTFSPILLAENPEQGATDWWPMFGYDEARSGYSTSNISGEVRLLNYTSSVLGKIRSSPAVVYGDKIYVGDTTGRVCAWGIYGLYLPPQKSYGQFGPVHSSPAVVEGLVYVGSDDKQVYALDAASLDTVRNFTTGGEVRSSPVVSNGIVYVGSSDGYLYALNASTLAEKWRFRAAYPIRSSPALSADTIFFGSEDGRVYALEKENGRYKWHFPTGGPVLSSPAIADGVVFIGSNDTKVYALDAETGSLVWAAPYETNGNVTSSPAVGFGKVFIGSDDGYIHAVNATNGNLVWKNSTGGPVSSSPALSADGKVVVGSNDTRLYVFDVETGEATLNHNTGGPIFSSPAIAKGMIFVGSDDGRVYAFGVNTPPFAAFTVNPSQDLIITQRVKFDASASYDNDSAMGDTITKYVWNLGDGPFEGPKIFNHTFFRPRAYEVTLTVWDKFEAYSSTSRSIMISDAWSMFGHDQNHSGHSASLAPVDNNLAWSKELEQPVFPDSYIYPSPIAAPVRIGDSFENLVFACSRNNTVYCYYAVNGTQKWKAILTNETGINTRSSPAYSEGFVYVGCNNGNIFRLDAASGAIVWNDTVSANNWLSSPTISSSRVFISCRDRRVYAYSTMGGPKIQSVELDGDVWSSPAVAYGLVFVGTQSGSVYALNESTLTVKWRYQTAGQFYSSPAVSDGRVFIGSRDNKLYVLNATTSNPSGEALHSYVTEHDVDSSPAVADGVVYVASRDHNVYAFNYSTHEQLWNSTIGEVIWSSPAIAENKIFVGSQDGKIYALSIPDNGSIVWTYQTGGPVQSSPAILNDYLYTSSQDGNLYAFHNETHDIAVSSIEASTYEVLQGGTVNINVSLTNEGTYNETDVNATLYYDSTIINSIQINMSRGDRETLHFIWDTNATGTPVPVGTYQISAYAALTHAVDDDISDNNRTADQNITVTLHIHDVAVLNVITSKTGYSPEALVGQGRSVRINVTVENQGDSEESFNVTIYAKNSSGTYYVGWLHFILNASESSTDIINWNNTSDFDICHYNLSAIADNVEGETDIADNVYDSPILVCLIGDVNADGYVGIDDVSQIAGHFGEEPTDPNWNGNVDLNDDDYVGADDIFDAASHFGEEYPGGYPSLFF